MVSFLDNAGTQHLITKLLDTVYPVGSIYITTSNTSPASFLGGSWERYAKGRTLIGVDEKDDAFVNTAKTGGHKTQTINGSAFRSHLAFDSAGRIWFEQFTYKNKTWNGIGSVHNLTYDWDSRNWGLTSYGKISGESTIDVLPPYVAVYMWKRIG